MVDRPLPIRPNYTPKFDTSPDDSGMDPLAIVMNTATMRNREIQDVIRSPQSDGNMKHNV
ncbi:hypothetical protein DPMN_006683 [Dreissena polymorpha]|uniref:Uncharacterized protein n=1 Tax=Dreissena polymorpha TaxID=45954 RepID=A0A9D4MSC2_DREPO|nr:hypothetical protein DPMN_006683 [Dreissena polymorpha]